jgi:hypothetical protein
MNWARRICHILLERKAGIVHPTLIEEINDAVRPNAPGHNRNSVDDQAKVIFASPQCIFCLFAFGDVHIRSVYADGFTRLVANDGSTAEDHMDTAVGPHHAILDIGRPSVIEKLLASSYHKFTVVRMHRLGVIIERRTLGTVIAEKEAQVLLCVEDFARNQVLLPTTGVT